MRKLIICLSIFFSSQGLIAQVIWNPPMDVASMSFGNNRPRIAIDANDNPIVIWGNTSKLMMAKWNGSGFSAAIEIQPTNTTIAEANWMGPEIASFGDTLYVVYKQTPEMAATSHIWCMRSFDGGLTFDSPVRVDYIGSNQSRFPAVSTDDVGNPIVAYMKSDSTMHNPQWYVCKSTDFGTTFSQETLSSGWSSSTTEACDCCMGSIAIAGSDMAMMYRDNNNNIRDSWVGISTDGGTSFSRGMNIDGHNWQISGCPSTSPDGFILNDTLYSTFMNGANSPNKIYFNKIYLNDSTANISTPLTSPLPAVVDQNYPQISHFKENAAVVWKQIHGGKIQISMVSTENIYGGFPKIADTVAQGLGLNNPDIYVTNSSVMIVWQDNLSKTVKFRRGTFASHIGIEEKEKELDVRAYPNPSNDSWKITVDKIYGVREFILSDLSGNVLRTIKVLDYDKTYHEVPNSDLNNGIYILKIFYDNQSVKTIKLIKD